MEFFQGIFPVIFLGIFFLGIFQVIFFKGYFQKFIINAKNGFWKLEVCGQTMLPDRSTLLVQNWWKMPKLKTLNETFLSNFQTIWYLLFCALPHNFYIFCADIQKWREKLKHEELICLHLFLPPFPFTTKLSKSSLSSFFSSENCWCIREKNSAMFVKSRRSRGLFRIFAL